MGERPPRLPEGHIQSDDCWCDPEILQVCPECEEEDSSLGCWRCEGRGLIPVQDPFAPVVAVHRYD